MALNTLYNAKHEDRVKGRFTCSYAPVKYRLLKASCITKCTELLICDVHFF